MTAIKSRKYVVEILNFITSIQARVEQARATGADPDGLLPRLQEGEVTSTDMLYELRRANQGGPFLSLMTAKPIGDAMGGHIGGLNLMSRSIGGDRYFVLPDADQLAKFRTLFCSEEV